MKRSDWTGAMEFAAVLLVFASWVALFLFMVKLMLHV